MGQKRIQKNNKSRELAEPQLQIHRQANYCVGFLVLTAVSMKSTVFWEVMQLAKSSLTF
jgi:hypothetical protein